MEVAFGILGTTALRLDGAFEEEWANPKPKAMLAALLLRPGHALSGETLLRWVWAEGQRLPKRTVATLDTYATRIRRLLDRLPIPAELRGSSGTYRLETDRSYIDYVRFRELTLAARAHARDGDPAMAARLTADALRLCRGRPLADLRSDRATEWRDRFERDELIPAHAEHLSALLELGRAQDVLVRLDDLQSDHPTNLRLYKLRMLTLRTLERDHDLTEYYLAVRKQLVHEGDDPAAGHLTRYYQELVTDKFGATTPPAVRLEYRPRQLPHDVPDFIGRADVLAALDAASVTADDHPRRGVVVLEGMPGVGKTALSVHWGHRVRSRFPDGDLFVDLNGFSRDPAATHAAVVDDLLVALGEEPTATASFRSREVTLRRVLADRYTLVILDNARNSAQVRALLPLLADCLVVITSRQSLDHLSASYGVRRIRVGPMSTEESTRLLTAHLGDDGDPRPRQELARLCGGLPLVITVVGQHIADFRVLDSTGSAERPDPRGLLLQLGHTGDGDTSPQAIFTFSYQALPPAAQRLFRLMGLHPGRDFSVAVARACGGQGDAVTRDSLAVLTGAHLLERSDTHDRYRFHDLIRECALRLAHIDETPAARRAAERRLLSYYLCSASAADRVLYPNNAQPPPLEVEPAVAPRAFHNQDETRAWMSIERGNLGAAVLFAARSGHNEFAWRLPHAICTFYERHGHHDECRVARETAVTAARTCADEEAEASSMADLGKTYIALGRLDDARRCLDHALRYCTRVEFDFGAAVTLYHLGRLEVLRGATRAGIALFERCLALVHGTRHEVVGWALLSLGEALRVEGEPTEALLHLRQAEQLAIDNADRSAHATCLAGIAAVRRELGEFGEAAAYCEKALATAEEARDLNAVATVCAALADIERACGHDGRAEAFALRAVTLAEQFRNVPLHAQALTVLGSVFRLQGRAAHAQRAWTEACHLFEQLGDRPQVTAIQTMLRHLPLDG